MIYDLVSNYDSHEPTTIAHNFSFSSRSTLLTAHPKFDLSSFKTSLAMHEASPKIQAYYQFYETVVGNSPAGREVARKEEERASMGGQGYVCESWVEWRGKGFCHVDELRRDMELSLGLGSGDSSG
jgi:UDP-glucose:glycoprotein glucosyltransferase